METFKENIPETFNIKYNSVYFGETTYLLNLDINLDISELSTQKKFTLELKVVLPSNYPDTEYKKYQSRVAYLSTHYNITKKNLSVDLFYVYNNKEEYKKLIKVGLETFNTKGLGKYMLCRAIRYLLQKSWFDRNSTITLIAAGNECFHKIDTYDECMDIFKDYPQQLFYFLDLHRQSVLKDKLQTEYFDSSYYKTRKSDIDPIVLRILKEETTKDEELLTLLKKLACYVKTNLNLVKYYKKYGFEEDQIQYFNYPFFVKMSGSVNSILSECWYGKMVDKGREYNERKSAIDIPLFSDDEWRFRPRRKLSSKSAKKRRNLKNKSKSKSKKRSPKPRRR